MKLRLKVLKANVLTVTTSQAYKLLSDTTGNSGKVLADSDSKMPNGEQTRNDLTKTLDSAKKALQDRKSVSRFSLMPGPLWMPR